MGKNRGWIKIHRQIWDSDVWQSSEPFDRRSAWIDLILMANHEAAPIQIGKDKRVLLPGQFHTSVSKLSERWHWNPKKVRRFLGKLSVQQMVHIEGSANGTTLTIENYAFFQNSGRTRGAEKGPAEGSAKGSQTRNIRNKEAKRPKNAGSVSGFPEEPETEAEVWPGKKTK